MLRGQEKIQYTILYLLCSSQYLAQELLSKTRKSFISEGTYFLKNQEVPMKNIKNKKYYFGMSIFVPVLSTHPSLNTILQVNKESILEMRFSAYSNNSIPSE